MLVGLSVQVRAENELPPGLARPPGLRPLETVDNRVTPAEDAKKQKEALERLAAAEAQEALRRQQEDALRWQRQEKIRKLKDQTALAEIAKKDEDGSMRITAVERLTDQVLLMEIAKNDTDVWVRHVAVERLTNQVFLAKVGKDGRDSLGVIAPSLSAVLKVTDQALLEEIVKSDSARVRGTAVPKLTNQMLLAEIAKTDSDILVRQKATLILNDQAALAEIAQNDTNEWVRATATSKLADQAILTEIARIDNSYDVRHKALSRLDQALLVEIAKNDKDPVLRTMAVSKLNNQVVLADFAKNDENEWARGTAVSKLTDQVLLAQIAKNDKKAHVRIQATSKLEDQRILAGIVKNDEDKSVRVAAVQRLDNQTILTEVVRDVKHSDVRQAALSRLTDRSVLMDFAQNANDYSLRRMAASMIKDPLLLEEATKMNENEGLASLIERASVTYDHVYLAIRNKIIEDGANALPVLAEIAVDESLPWQQRLVARICYERIERRDDIEKLLATDWYAHPEFEPRWNEYITGAEPFMMKLVVDDMKKAGLWYYCLEVLWKTTNDNGKIFRRNTPENWAGGCATAVKDNPEERIWVLRICSDILKDAFDLDPYRSRAGWINSMLFREEKPDSAYVLEHRAPPPVSEEPPFRLGTNIIRRAKQP